MLLIEEVQATLQERSKLFSSLQAPHKILRSTITAFVALHWIQPQFTNSELQHWSNSTQSFKILWWIAIAHTHSLRLEKSKWFRKAFIFQIWESTEPRSVHLVLLVMLQRNVWLNMHVWIVCGTFLLFWLSVYSKILIECAPRETVCLVDPRIRMFFPRFCLGKHRQPRVH